MRGFAALLVFFVHFRALFGSYVSPESILYRATAIAGSMGHAGVDVFFLLSGFLMYGIVLDSKSPYIRYLWHRLRRLYPTFLVIFTAYVVLSALFPANSKLPHSNSASMIYLIENLMMLPGIVNIIPMITVAWSLSYEMVFYLALPLFVNALFLRRWKSPQRIALFLILAITQAVLCTIGVSKHSRMIMFVSGMILFEVGRFYGPLLKLRAWSEQIAIILFGANLLAIGLLQYGVGSTSLTLTNVLYLYSASLFATTFLFTMHTVFFDGVLSRIFSWNYLRWVGNVSYSYYLVHGLVLNGIRYFLNASFAWIPHTRLFFVALLVFCMGATLMAAAALFLGIEKPFSLAGRGISPRVSTPLRASPATDSTTV